MSANDDYWFCDRCGNDLGKRGWSLGTGEVDEEFGAPVMEFLCDQCYRIHLNSRSVQV